MEDIDSFRHKSPRVSCDVIELFGGHKHELELDVELGVVADRRRLEEVGVDVTVAERLREKNRLGSCSGKKLLTAQVVEHLTMLERF